MSLKEEIISNLGDTKARFHLIDSRMRAEPIDKSALEAEKEDWLGFVESLKGNLELFISNPEEE